MTNIKQIQDFNRKKIIFAVFDEIIDTKVEEIRELILSHPNFKEIGEAQVDLLASDLDLTFTKPKITLNKVLLALERIHFGLDTCEEDVGYIWIYKNGIYNDWIIWDLTKETLEEQSEVTQIAVAKLLGYENE